MFNPLALFGAKSGKKDSVAMKNEIARVLSLDSEKLAQFESAYRSQILDKETDEGFFQTNSRKAAERNHAINPDAAPVEYDADALDAMTKRVVDELLAQTSVYVYDGKSERSTPALSALPEGEPVTSDEIATFPTAVRPQLTGNLMRRDIEADASLLILYHYATSADEKKPRRVREQAYHTFRQGLDITDLDPLTYAIIDTNRASMGHWLPKLVAANEGKDFFKIPRTTVAKVPLTLLQLTRLDYNSLTPTTLKIVDLWARRAFELNESESYFIKTGTYSSKFDFRNAKVTGAKEVRELGEYLLYIHHQALMMASPLSTPAIYGASTTTEWVVREFVEDVENKPTIYKGLPLRAEYRVFVDCDEKRVIGCAPYWEPETMKKRFGHGDDADSPHQIHDYVIYKSHEHVLMNSYYNNKSTVVERVEELLPDLDLRGQWSIDVMQNGVDMWLIDMAPAEQSAYYEKYVPAELRRPTREDWTPRLPGTKANEAGN